MHVRFKELIVVRIDQRRGQLSIRVRQVKMFFLSKRPQVVGYINMGVKCVLLLIKLCSL